MAREFFRFELPARLQYRDAARDFLSVTCAQLIRERNLPSDVHDKLVSAFVEAFNNAVMHGGAAEDEPEQVSIVFQISDDMMSVEITGRGPEFDLDNVPEPELDLLPERGMGIFIIKNFMDRVRCVRDGDRNRIIMEKDLASPGGTTGNGDTSCSTSKSK